MKPLEKERKDELSITEIKNNKWHNVWHICDPLKTLARSSSLWRTRSTSVSNSAFCSINCFKVPSFLSRDWNWINEVTLKCTRNFWRSSKQFLRKGDPTNSICFNERLLSTSVRCCSGSCGSPTAFSVSSRSWTGVNLANSQTLSCGKNYKSQEISNQLGTRKDSGDRD